MPLSLFQFSKFRKAGNFQMARHDKAKRAGKQIPAR
jgi:hypothetical protein